MDKKRLAFGKENFILLFISIIVIVIGFIVMAEGKFSEETGFDPSIFSTRRILIAPVIIISGFGLVICAILKKPK
ncbi:MAG: hypothetical protein Pg6B_00030 [Candidatus Azobacteroides pseudotrichonymphae]|jgi:membrane-bound ClpP family serine protease|uniref:DUF3098 domain-containing protein n=1 Tax=Azobacteroides pseudotrichonymphae genomovar. CFP2 TaxID=511995 RepID=B6YR71_AZOPC|nr:DUF3098 domain-containing protein [Candidatus Azobacteroides pseudotrichonymphae]MDR0530083.1 DUF3098 domain-containing protein [Bacteroidales bacterium OttesenSCG-928-I14]BAG83693.1 conserved hypothetical protein [Candidatus Azobacteroides pseudotrichonymphae genomovar. CFP2]GMO31980.1 MAG: hypothetical protein Pg6B_00030 [Candidatus Azobacteroides pseudotrichonymphae]